MKSYEMKMKVAISEEELNSKGYEKHLWWHMWLTKLKNKVLNFLKIKGLKSNFKVI